MNTDRLVVRIAPVLLLLASSQLFAQSTVDERVVKLEETVRVLERRVASLEDQLRERNSSTTVAPDKANWRKLQKGMSAKDVEKLLGSPGRVEAYSTWTTWYYPDAAWVRFCASSRKVSAWRQP